MQVSQIDNVVYTEILLTPVDQRLLDVHDLNNTTLTFHFKNLIVGENSFNGAVSIWINSYYTDVKYELYLLYVTANDGTKSNHKHDPDFKVTGNLILTEIFNRKPFSSYVTEIHQEKRKRMKLEIEILEAHIKTLSSKIEQSERLFKTNA